MVARGEGKLVVWPCYFNAALTRAEGRRVPKASCVEEPRAGAIAEAARSLGLNPTLEKDALHPRHWWSDRGRVVVDKRWSKEETLVKIASRL